MEKSPLISVIIPVYNGEKYIKEAIESVLDQDYKPIELIIVDDGSTDSTGQIVNSFFNSQIYYYYKENGGVSSARNFGLEKAKGTYIKYVDCDDVLPKHSLFIQQKHQLSLADNEISVGCFSSQAGPCRVPNTHSTAGYTPWMCLFPAKALYEVGGFDEKMWYAEDTELTFKLKEGGWNFKILHEVIYHYRIGKNPESLFLRKKDWRIMRYFFEKHINDYSSFTSAKEYYRFFIIQLFQDGDIYDYLYLRRKMPFIVHPSQINESRILGYLLWYGSYLFHFDRLRYIIKRF